MSDVRPAYKCMLAMSAICGMLIVTGQAAYAAGTLTITKAVLVEKDAPNAEVASGYADADLSVDFKGDATCTCTCDDTNITYTWHFGDTTTANGKNASHTYGANGAGNRGPWLHAECTCGAIANSNALSVSAIDDIRVDRIGDKANPNENGRLCFNRELRIAGIALPAGVNGSDKIDWHVAVVAVDVDRANTATGVLPNLANNDWPASNAGWGAGTLYISIDGPHVAGQQNELKLTGAASFVSNPESIKKYFDGGDGDNQATNGGDPNWYFYYTQALANGPHTYAAAVNWGVTLWAAPRNPPAVAVQIGANANNQSPRWPAPCIGMNNFANIVQHEHWHRLHREHNYASHGANGLVAAPNDPDGDHVCSAGCQAGGWEQANGTNANLAATFGGVVDREWIARQQETNTNHTGSDWAGDDGAGGGGAQW